RPVLHRHLVRGCNIHGQGASLIADEQVAGNQSDRGRHPAPLQTLEGGAKGLFGTHSEDLPKRYPVSESATGFQTVMVASGGERAARCQLAFAVMLIGTIGVHNLSGASIPGSFLSPIGRIRTTSTT